MSSMWFLILCAVALTSACGKLVTVSNVQPRRDTHGQLLEVGDGCLSQFPDGTYWLYGTRYQPCVEPDTSCYTTGASIGEVSGYNNGTQVRLPAGQGCGWRNMTFAAYSSQDLTEWTLRSSNILPAMTDPKSPYSSELQAFFEPCVVYNSKTRKYVLWFIHPYIKGVAIAERPDGPFEIVSWDPEGFPADLKMSSDFYLWQHTDGTVFMKHNGFVTQAYEWVSQLSDDYLRIVATSSPLTLPAPYNSSGQSTEGGGIFEHSGKWYVMAGHGCCFCSLGSNGFYWVSDQALGPYRFMGDVIPRYASGAAVTHAQQFSVAALRTAVGTLPMFIGVRFGSAPDRTKRHDFQFWAPLQFTDYKLHNISWIDQFQVDLSITDAWLV